MNSTSPSPTLGWRALLPILTVHFLGTLGYSLAIPFLVYVVLDFGGAAWTYGAIGALYSSFQLVGAPILGRWSDRIGRKWVLILSQAGTFVAWSLFLVALSLPVTALGAWGGATLTLPLLLVAVARALDGLTGGNMSVASAMVADLTAGQPEARQIAFGRMGMASSIGFAIGPAMAGVLGASSWGYTAPVAFAAALTGICALVTAFLLEEPNERAPEAPLERPAIEHVMSQQHKRCDRAPEWIQRSVLFKPDVALLLIGTFVMFLGFSFFYAAFPVHASTALEWDSGTMGGFFAVMSIFMVPSQGPLLSWMSSRLSPPVVFFIGMMSLVVAFVAFSVPGTGWAMVGAIAFAVGNGLAWPTFQTRIASVGGEAQGEVQGAATSASSLASIVGLLVGGMLYPTFGTALFVLVALVLGLVALGTPWWFGLRRSALPPRSHSPVDSGRQP